MASNLVADTIHVYHGQRLSGSRAISKIAMQA